VTVVESAVATELFTETTTETASTETLLFTDATTITATTQTDLVTATTTIIVTTTEVQLAPTFTITSTNYQSYLKARQTGSPLPDYVEGACPDWDKYVAACKCAGVEASTVTATAATETVTVTADTAITSTVSTVSITQTDTISATTTTSSTQINTDSHTETVTATVTTASFSTTTVSVTSTPTVVVPLDCKPKGQTFRASSPLNDGTTRWMNVVNQAMVAWQIFPGAVLPQYLASSTWVLDSNGYLELPNAGSVALAAYVDLSKTGPSVQVVTAAKAVVDAAVAAGTWARVRGCVNSDTNELTMTANERSNILTCGNALFMSTGNGGDIQLGCVQLFPTGNQV
jgi:hypothetical protein